MFTLIIGRGTPFHFFAIVEAPAVLLMLAAGVGRLLAHIRSCSGVSRCFDLHFHLIYVSPHITGECGDWRMLLICSGYCFCNASTSTWWDGLVCKASSNSSKPDDASPSGGCVMYINDACPPSPSAVYTIHAASAHRL